MEHQLNASLGLLLTLYRHQSATRCKGAVHDIIPKKVVCDKQDYGRIFSKSMVDNGFVYGGEGEGGARASSGVELANAKLVL